MLIAIEMKQKRWGKNNPGICSRGNREKGGMEILSNGGNLDKERAEPTGIFGITRICIKEKTLLDRKIEFNPIIKPKKEQKTLSPWIDPGYSIFHP